MQSSLSLWSLDSESELIYNANFAIGSTSPNGASKRYGVDWSNHYALNDRLLLGADFAWAHARYANRNDNGKIGAFVPNVVPKVVTIGFSARKLGPWSSTPSWLSQNGTLTAPSSCVADARIEREFGPSASISLDVLNVFDRKYYDIAYEQDYRVSPTAPIVPAGITVHPGEPRQVRPTLRLKLP